MQKGLCKKSLFFLFGFTLFNSNLFHSILFAAPATIWQGPYVGAYLGGGFGYNHATTDVGQVTDTSYFTTTADINAVNNAGTSTKTPSSAIGGIKAGHDWAFRQMVYGIIFDYGALPLNSSEKAYNQSYPSSSNEYSILTHMDTHWLFSLRGRLGYSLPISLPSLLYATGGMALSQLTIKNSFSDNSSLSAAGGNNTTNNEIGWTAGLGIEIASFNHLSMDFEYLYLHLPSEKTTSTLTNTEDGFGIPLQSLNSPLNTTGKFHANLVKIGLNYRFNE